MNVYVVIGEYGMVLRIYETAAKAEAFIGDLATAAHVQKWPVEA